MHCRRGGRPAQGTPRGRRSRGIDDSVAAYGSEMDVLLHHGMRFEVRDAGPPDGPAVVLLHGFPGDLDTFEMVEPLLHRAGFRTLTLHQRGYCDTARPSGVSSYAVPLLVGDVVALLDEAGLDAAHVVGHDWGGVVAWHLAGARPDRVRSLTVLSTPHPQAFRHSLVRSTQLLRSWYALSWQLPLVPEAAMTARGGAVLRRGLVSSGLPADVAERYTAGMLRPGRLTAALDWYRALGRRPRTGARLGAVSVPTTYVWSSGDVALGRRAADDTARFVSGPYRYEVLEGEPHWLPEVLPTEVARVVIDRVTSSAT